MLRKNALWTRCFLSTPATCLKAVWANCSIALAWSSKGSFGPFSWLVAGPRSPRPHDVSLIKPHSKTLGPACQTGPELKDAHRCWPFSDGGHILKLADELLNIAFTSKNRWFAAIPVTRWCLTRHLELSGGWSLWHVRVWFFLVPFSYLVLLGDISYSESCCCLQCSNFVGWMKLKWWTYLFVRENKMESIFQ